jgi:type IV pilus assembly protein PilE
MKCRGFSLLELLFVLAIVAIVAGFAFSAYQQHIVRGHQTMAKAALIENAHFMERWYADNGDYRQGSSSWPELPVSSTETFDIEFSASANNTEDDHFLIQAKPKKHAAWLGNTFLEIDQSGNIKYCNKDGNSKKCAMRVL